MRSRSSRAEAEIGQQGAAVGYRLLRQGRAAKARRRLEQAVQRAEEPGAGLLNNLALAQWRSGDRRAALATFRQGLKSHPGDRRLGRNLGRLALADPNRKRRILAVRILTEAQSSRGRPGRFSLIGGLYRSLGELEAAESAYRRELAAPGEGGWRTWLGLGLTLERAGKAHEARKAYARVLRALPQDHQGTRERVRQRLEGLPAREAG
jgi:tetratricopeptide (TPR) repeat protein